MHVLLQENIGIVFEQQGKFEEAEQRYSETLQIRLKVFGEDSLDVAKTRMNIANICNGQGRYDEALKIYTGVVQIQERALGRNHPLVADTYNKYESAPFCLFALFRHSYALLCVYACGVCSIGIVHRKMGENEKALEYYNKSLEIQIKVRGQDHPVLADTYVNIGVVYKKQAKYPEALNTYHKALAIYEQVHGRNHPDVAVSYTK